MRAQVNKSYEFGPFRLDTSERVVMRNGEMLPLTAKAFHTLLVLVENSGHVVERDELMQKVWADTFVEEGNLSVTISMLRKALGDSSSEPRYIATIPGRGYRLVTNVREVRDESTVVEERTRSQILIEEESQERKEGAVRPQLEQETERLSFTIRKKLLITVMIGIALLVIATGASWIGKNYFDPTRPPLAFNKRDWILITGFENRTGEPLFDGTFEYALERELSNSQFVNVVPSERVEDALRLMKKSPDTKVDVALGREVCLRDGGIRALLAGRVEKTGSTYVLSASLIDPNQNRTITSASAEAASQEQIWPAVRRLSNWVRETLGEALASIEQSGQALEKVTTPSLRALQLYTQAAALGNQSKWGAAEQILRQALTEDPEFASAYIFLAYALYNQGKPPEEWKPVSARALELLEGASERERYFIEGSYYSLGRQNDKAVSSYEALVQRYPDHLWGRNNLAYVYMHLGRWQEAITQYTKLAELRPNDLRANRLAASFLMLRDIAEARRLVQHTREIITPEMTTARPYDAAWIQFCPVHDLWLQGDIESALNEVDHLAQTIDSRSGKEKDAFANFVGRSYLCFGKLQAAEEFFQKLSDKNRSRYSFLARLALARGDKSGLRKYLRKQLSSPTKRDYINALLLTRAGLASEAQKALFELTKRDVQQAGETARVLVKTVKGEFALSQGKTAEAISLLQETIPLVRWNSSLIFFLGSESLASAFEQQGDLQKSLQVLEKASQEKALAYDGHGSTGAFWLRIQFRLAQLYRKLGRAEDAQKIETELLKLLAYADPDHPILRQLKGSKGQAIKQSRK